MAKLSITLACWDYDRTRPLMDGTIQPEGVELNYLPLPPSESFWRMIRYQEFDVSEMSLASYTILRSRGEAPFIAIPVFPSRIFRHGCIYINTASGIQRPEDLAGKRMGVPEYQMTAAVWIRGLLQHEYNVPPESIHWFYGGQEEPRKEPVIAALPKGVRVEPIPPGKTLAGMLEEGELDALGTPQLPSPFLRRSPRVRRLFPNFREVEEAYFRKTGLFPIMHTIVIKESLYRAHPWLARSLFKAFEAAKELCYRNLYETSALKCTLVWLIDEVERERAILGEDYWPYGFEANRHVLETLTQYLVEQGLTERKVDPQELFAPNTLEPLRPPSH